MRALPNNPITHRGPPTRLRHTELAETMNGSNPTANGSIYD
jgi:hypothetical protein